MASPRLQEAKGTLCCSRTAAAPPSSTSLARMLCATSPARCPAVIHGSSPALPFMATLRFLTFSALGKTMPKRHFLYVLPPALFVPVPLSGGRSHSPCPIVLPMQQWFLACYIPPPESSQITSTSTGKCLFPTQQPVVIPMSPNHSTSRKADRPGNVSLLMKAWARDCGIR